MSINNKKIFSEIGSTIGKIAEQMDPFLAGFYGADKDENKSIMIKSENQHKNTSMPIGGDIKTEEDMNLFMSGMRSEAQKNADRQASARARYSARPEVRQGLIDYNEAQLKEKGRQGTYERIYAEEYKKDPEKAVINAMMAVDKDKSLKAEEKRLKERIKELKTASDIEQTGRKLAYHESLRASEEARARGELNPALAGLIHGDEVEAKFNELAQKTRDNTYHYARNREIAKREEILKNPDFAKFVTRGGTVKPQNEILDENWLGKEVVNFINDPEYAQYYTVEDNSRTLDAERFLKLTDKEKDIIRAYASMNDYATVEDYYKLLERDLNARVQNEKNEKSRDFSYKMMPLGAIGNVASGFVNFPATFANAGQAIKNGITGEFEPTDENSPAFRMTHFKEQSEDGVGEWAYDFAGGGERGELAETITRGGLSVAGDLAKNSLGGWGVLLNALDKSAMTTHDALRNDKGPGEALWHSTVSGVSDAATSITDVPFNVLVEAPQSEFAINGGERYNEYVNEAFEEGAGGAGAELLALAKIYGPEIAKGLLSEMLER